MELSIDKLPLKRLETIEENGVERFPSDVGYDDKRVSLIRRIDFAWALEEDTNKRQKKSSSKDSSIQPWPWQSVMENLQLAHQELSVIIDLINTVEANDAVTVTSMTRPKQLPDEALSDLAVSSATKLQCFRHLGKYFKNSAKALERQIAKETRFYSALIRLQQNWKVKRQRIASSASGGEGFTIDLFDNSLYDHVSMVRPSIATIRIDRDSSGMLAIDLNENTCRSLRLEFSGTRSGPMYRHPILKSFCKKHNFDDAKERSLTEDECVSETHFLLRQAHRAIFEEQVFGIVNHEAFVPSSRVSVTGIRENFLQLTIGEGTSIQLFLSHPEEASQPEQNKATSPLNTPDAAVSLLCYEIYLQQILHEHIFSSTNAKHKTLFSTHKEGFGLLSCFCRSLAHRIFSNRVVSILDRLVIKVPYLRLITRPMWHSRASSWLIYVNAPPKGLSTRVHDATKSKLVQTTVMVNDDCVSIEAEGSQKVECDLADLALMLLQLISNQVIGWLHEEALMIGMKTNKDFLRLLFELDQGESLSLVAEVDPEDCEVCVCWWLVMEHASMDGQISLNDRSNGVSEFKRFLGGLSLEVLQSTLMDLVSLCDVKR